MTERPILFSGPMVRAILEGRKTQTRRVFKHQWNSHVTQAYHRPDGNWIGCTPSGIGITAVAVTPYRTGDRLWVREGFQYIEGPPGQRQSGRVLFAADMRDTDGKRWSGSAADVKWRPSIHMPRWASRLTLTVTDVRVQRVQDITNEDADAEGCKGFYAPCHPDQGVTDGMEPWQEFRDLWDSLNAARGFGWDANPWVVAYSFTVEQRNIDRGGPK